MRATCMVIVALFFLVVSNLAIVISFATPYWIEFRNPVFHSGGNHHRGLWAYCDSSSCKWVFDNNFLIQKDLGVLIQVTQALYSIGAVCGILSLLIATIALCCDCKCNAHKAVAILLILAVVFMSIGLVIYGIAMNKKYDAAITWNESSQAMICWSFWLGVGACVVSFFTAIIYAFESHVTSYN
ncbi:transmembrane protein 47 [Octopus bimaculoides]|uniref:transmembrane protein 47 n=1 Tax=Octopus bimaculoides TaxID=37653 RepID=UPI00071C2699|nr:transmembrane protein 47 [Octopus bimaculoides]|eukprot:XP_014778601.1 PREDICTED: transmembrane protein 47-like [Octopus bimaculoides]